MRKITLAAYFLAAILLSLSYAYSQNKTIVLDGLRADAINFIRGNEMDLLPGDTIAIPGGVYGGLRFYDINGLPGLPITIVNKDSLVTIVEDNYSAFEMQGSSYIHITGSGVEGIKYGIKLRATQAGAQGMNITNLSTDIEIDHIEVAEAGFAGIMMKTDPDCNRPETLRSSGFVMKNLSVHHNKIHHTEGEGIYIGYTGSSIYTSNRKCEGTPVFGHLLENVEIAHNIVRQTGYDGIQLNLTHKNGVIRSNTVTNYGRRNQLYQNFALSVGAGEYQIYNNKAVNTQGGTGMGMQLLAAFAGSRVYNNVFVDPMGHGMFIHSRLPLEGEWGYVIANNTIVRPEKAGIFYNSRITEYPEGGQGGVQDDVPVHIANNLIVDPGYDYEGGPTWKQNTESFLDFNDRSTRTAMLPTTVTNLLTRDIDTLMLRNVAKNNFQPANFHSPLVDAGTDLTALGVTFDNKYKDRPSGEAFDIGAFEFRVRTLSDANIERFTSASLDEKANVGIYPNPTVDTVTLENPNYTSATINIYTDNGARVLTVKDYALGDPIDLSYFKAGRYILVASYPDRGNSSHQLVVSK